LHQIADPNSKCVDERMPIGASRPALHRHNFGEARGTLGSGGLRVAVLFAAACACSVVGWCSLLGSVGRDRDVGTFAAGAVGSGLVRGRVGRSGVFPIVPRAAEVRWEIPRVGSAVWALMVCV
jgi:hypothetical protein